MVVAETFWSDYLWLGSSARPSRGGGAILAKSTVSANVFEKIEPSAPLREYVRHYMYRDRPAPPLTRPVPPRPDMWVSFSLTTQQYDLFDYRTGRVDALPGAIVVGPQTRRVVDLVAKAHHATFYIFFRPAGFYRLFGQPIAPLVDLAHAASDVIGGSATSLHDRLREARDAGEMARLAEQFLMSRLAGARPFHAVHRAAEILIDHHGETKLPLLVEATGLSERQFERSFTAHIGATPKLYARLARFHYAFRLKTAAPSQTWMSVSHEAGYFDQSHLVRDFHILTGMSPSLFLSLFPGRTSVSS